MVSHHLRLLRLRTSEVDEPGTCAQRISRWLPTLRSTCTLNILARPHRARIMENKQVHVARAPQVYDAIVVGSGISGGWAAKELCEKGLKTLVLERGRPLQHGTGYVTEHKAPWE